ncbi:hypothetical protein C8A01DRAFT_37728 [Parachaetomium inaequale]|uniref:Uncharacterized protein n=1 Tax=Parachaetomium inaequale TaxID=2588326 RepID=A0AAN6PFL4_9PEZI|nr:hypothetical protein C8A01DRAFT_37728 [Parachaetomium inaequale]
MAPIARMPILLPTPINLSTNPFPPPPTNTTPPTNGDPTGPNGLTETAPDDDDSDLRELTEKTRLLLNRDATAITIQAVLDERHHPMLWAERADELARAAREFYLQAVEGRRRRERTRMMWWGVCVVVVAAMGFGGWWFLCRGA